MKKVFVAFIDYKKAFDSIDQDVGILWKVLEHFGMKGNISPLLYQYIIAKRAVMLEVKVGIQIFYCSSGLRQGCILSPMFFSYIIQVVKNEIHKTGDHGIGLQLFPDVTEILMLLFADDLVLIADSPYQLQLKLNFSNDISQTLGLVVTFEKSKIVVFRNG